MMKTFYLRPEDIEKIELAKKKLGMPSNSSTIRELLRMALEK